MNVTDFKDESRIKAAKRQAFNCDTCGSIVYGPALAQWTTELPTEPGWYVYFNPKALRPMTTLRLTKDGWYEYGVLSYRVSQNWIEALEGQWLHIEVPSE